MKVHANSPVPKGLRSAGRSTLDLPSYRLSALQKALSHGIQIPAGSKPEDFELEALPVTPAQQDILAVTGLDRSVWVTYTFTFPNLRFASYDRLRMIWQAIASFNPALRTYLTHGDARFPHTIQHQVLKRAVPLRFTDTEPKGIPAPYLVYQESENGLSTLSLHIHPVLIDESSVEKLRDDFQLFHDGYSIPFRMPSQVYIRDVYQRNQDEALAYWHQALDSFRPKPLLRSHIPRGDGEETLLSIVDMSTDLALPLSAFEQTYNGLSEPLLLATWGIVISRYLGVEDVAFNTRVRDDQIEGSENIIASLESNVPLRINIKPEERIQELLPRVKEMLYLAQQFGYVGSRKIENLNPGLKDVQTSIRKVSGVRPASSKYYRTSDVTIEVDLASTQVLVFHSPVIKEARVKLMIAHFLEALKSILLHPDCLLQEVNLVSPAERNRLIEIGQAKFEVVPGLAHELIEDQCRASPDAAAVHFLNQESITYSQLNSMANRVARQIRKSIEVGTTVAVHMAVSTSLIVTLLAILKAGGAYVIMDPAHPQDRKKFVLEDSGAKLCIVDSQDLAQISEMGVDCGIASIDTMLGVSEDDTNLEISLDVESPAYIIYTSGSTGHPKGVVLSHRAASSGISCAADLPSFRTLLFYNPVFSAAQRTILSTLAHGGCLCLASGPDLQLRLSDTINSLQINNLGITSSTISLVDPESVPTLRRVTVTGESLNPDLIDLWADRVELRNNYGLSECTQLNWGAVLSKSNPASRAIGFASDTTSAYILDPDSTQLTPFLVTGELCLSGSQLASGYRNRPELTASVFVPNPFSPGETLYRTGDMAYRLEDGSIEIVGRKDSQIKISGQRVEPSEVQATLRSHAGIEAIAVVAATFNGQKSLVSCIVPRPGWVWSSLILQLRAIALAKLPTYMIPRYWLEVSALPVNRNGKTDMHSLRTLVEQKTIAELVGTSVASTSSSDRVLTETELVLQAAIAKSLDLPIDTVDIGGSFLGFGGDSLRAINVVADLLEKGYSIGVADILLSETLSKIALAMKAVDERLIEPPKSFSLLPKDTNVELSRYDDVYPATPLQESVVSAHIASGTYVYDRVFNISGTDIEKLKSAFETVIQENPIYRTVFLQAGGSYLQGVAKGFSLPWKAYHGKSLEEVQKLTSDDRMELSRPFMRALQIDNGILIIRIHHALFDFWSSRFLFDDVAAVYLDLARPVRPPFSAFVREVLAVDADEAGSFWAAHLKDAPLTKLETKPGAPFNSTSLSLDLDLRALGVASGLTIGALAYASWALILWKHTRNQDVIFAITLSGRDANIKGIQHLNGPTLVTVPFRVHVDPSKSLLEFAKDIQAKLWDVARYSQFGMRKALEVAGHRVTPFDSMVNYLVKNEVNASTEEVLPSYGEKPVWQTGHTTLELEESSHGALELRVSGELEPTRTNFVAEQVAQVLRAMSQDGATRIEKVNFLSSAEAMFLGELSSKTAQPEATLLHQPFENIAASMPDQIAIEFEGEEAVSYAQLNARANRLARELVKYGVGPDVLVPICLAKSVDTIVCILAVLKAGGAFVPLDPDNPPERNNFIVEDVSATIVLTDENYAPIFAAQPDNVSVLDIFNLDQFHGLDTNLQIPTLSPDHLAYAIYTSGSTGLPKGVLIPHKSIAAGIEGIIVAEGVEQSWRNLQFSNYVFDVAIGDIFCTFGVGAVLCMAPFERMLADLADVVNSMQINRLFLTPTVARLLRPEQVPGVEGLYLAGEPVTPDLVETWAAHCTVMNCYGPTEASILTVVGEIEAGGNPRIIGQPLINTSALILDPENQAMVPYGAIGELCLGGSQLARGYLNRPEANASAFITRDGERLYRTGDLARWVASGRIECFGRKDSQVKINGHRIEIGEIESAILTTGSVKDVAVLVVEIGGKSQIVAFCVVEAGPEQDSQVLSDLHREKLALLSISLTMLAPYMVPQVWVPVHALPRLPSGKNDRKALARKAEDMGVELQNYFIGNEATEMHEAVTDEQILLQSLWGDLFSVDSATISITSSFFSQGGDSISAINLVGRCRGKGYLLTVSDVLAHPVLQDMALRMRSIAHKQGEYVVPQLEASDKLRVELLEAGIKNEAIQAIWPVAPGIEEFLIRGAEKEQYWQCQTVRRVPEDFDFAHWQHLAVELTRRNDILRSMWVEDGGRWLQIVLKDAPIDIATVECDTEEDAKKVVAGSWESRFEIAAGTPFVRYRLIVTRSTGTRDLLIKIHHAMYDGTLLRIFDDQFRALHRQQQLPHSVEFSQYVGYMSATEGHRDTSLAFWRDLLANRSAPYPECRHATATGMALESMDSRVDAFAAQCGVTAPIVFQTAFTLLLAKLSGNTDVNYDNLITGRNIDMEDAQTINGNCANFLPFRSIIDSAITIRELLTSTQNLFWKTTEYGDVNTTKIYEACRETRNTAANRALFLFQPFEPVTGSVKHMRWMVMAGSSVQMAIDYALHLEVSKTSSGYKLNLKYDTELYSPGTAKEMAETTVHLLQEMMAKSFLPAQTLLL
jgi:amino acid adenylation domain-containing protein